MIGLKFIEKWKIKLFGRGVQTFKIEECDQDGKVLILRNVGKTKRRANSIIETWDSKGDEIVEPPIEYMENDVTMPAFIAKGGRTVNLYTDKSMYENLEHVIGKGATLDDITDAMDLGKSMKNTVIGIIIGVLVGVSVISPMLDKMFS